MTNHAKNIIFALSIIFLSGCFEGKMQNKEANCSRQIKQTQESIVCDIISSIGEEYKNTGDVRMCAGYGLNDENLSWVAYRSGLVLMKSFMPDCSDSERENAIKISPSQFAGIASSVCPDHKLKKYLECRNFFE